MGSVAPAKMTVDPVSSHDAVEVQGVSELPEETVVVSSTPLCPLAPSSEGSFSRPPEGISVGGWGDLPLPLLSIIFDDVMTAPQPHPDYLKPKARSWSSLCRVSRHWAAAMHDTAIGVCLPASLPDAAVRWLGKVKLRGIEFSAPKETTQTLMGLLSHPSVLSRSSDTLVGCIDAPFDGTWKPSSFPQLRTCALHRAGTVSTTFDMSLVKDLTHMEDLILGSGFSHAINWASLPSSVLQVVWTCPGRLPPSGRPATGHLTLDSWPDTLKLDSLVLEADYTLQLDPTMLSGRVSRIALHAPYLFMSTPDTSGGAYISPEKTTSTIVQRIAKCLVDDSQLIDLNISCFSLFAGCSELADMDSNALSTGQPDIMEALVTALQLEVRARPPSPSRPQLRVSRGHEGLELSLSRPPPDNDGSSAVLLSFDEPGVLEEQLPQLLASTNPVCSIAFMDFIPMDQDVLDAAQTTPQPPPQPLLAAAAAAAAVAASNPPASISYPPPGCLLPAADVKALVGHVPPPLLGYNMDGWEVAAMAGSSTGVVPPPRHQASSSHSTAQYESVSRGPSGNADGVHGGVSGGDNTGASTSGRDSDGDVGGGTPSSAATTALSCEALQQLIDQTSLASLVRPEDRPGLFVEAVAQRVLLTCRGLIKSSAHQLKEVTGLLLLPPSVLRAATGRPVPDGEVCGVHGHCGYCPVTPQQPKHVAAVNGGVTDSSGSSSGTSPPAADVPPVPPVYRQLLTPYMHLSRVSLVTLIQLTERDILPPTVVMVDFRAGGVKQRFCADAISNLLDMHSLTLRGYHSIDLGRLPATVRSHNGGAGRGLTLNIWDMPTSRTEPLGCPTIDVLPSPGPLDDANNALSVCLARGSPMMGGGVPEHQTPLAVDLGAWGKVALDVHVQCGAGAVLHLPRVSEETVRSAVGGLLGQMVDLVATLQTLQALEAMSPEHGGCLRTVSCQFAEDDEQSHIPTVQVAGRPAVKLLEVMLFVHTGIVPTAWDVTGRRLHEQGAMLVTLRKGSPDDYEDEEEELHMHLP